MPGTIVDAGMGEYDGEVIHFMRPNPNAKDIYKPLDIVEHIKHVKQYGTY